MTLADAEGEISPDTVETMEEKSPALATPGHKVINATIDIETEISLRKVIVTLYNRVILGAENFIIEMEKAEEGEPSGNGVSVGRQCQNMAPLSHFSTLETSTH